MIMIEVLKWPQKIRKNMFLKYLSGVIHMITLSHGHIDKKTFV